MTKELLIKFLNNQCTKDELKEVVSWIKSDSLNQRSIDWGVQEWKNFEIKDNIPSDNEFSALLDKVHHKINISKKKNSKTKIAQIVTWVTKAAAVLLLPVLAFLFYTLSEKSSGTVSTAKLSIDSLEIAAPIGSQTAIQLSDGSEVFLNHGSKLQYPYRFTGNTREVVLVGEGYFNIAHNPERPFIVKTKNLNVKAIGTSFNVLAYPGESIVSTTLVEGKISVERVAADNKIISLGSMVPGQHVDLDIETGKISSYRGDIEKYISWKDGKLIFEDESIVNIARRLSRWYNVEIEFADEIAKEYTYTATFTEETLFQILDLLALATPIDYKKVPRERLDDGTFRKQKIIIKKSE